MAPVVLPPVNFHLLPTHVWTRTIVTLLLMVRFFSPSGLLSSFSGLTFFGSTMIAWSLTIIRIIRQLLCDLSEGEPWWQLVKGDQCVLSPESRKVDSQHLRILSFGIIASRSISTWKRLFKCWNHCTESEFHESTIIITVNFHYTILSKGFAWTLKAKLNNKSALCSEVEGRRSI